MWNRRLELNLLQAVGMVWAHGSPLTAKVVRQIPENVRRNRERALHFFALLDQSLAARPFVAGDGYSIADITALCVLDFAPMVEIRPDPAAHEHRALHAAVSARPSAKA